MLEVIRIEIHGHLLRFIRMEQMKLCGIEMNADRGNPRRSRCDITFDSKMVPALVSGIGIDITIVRQYFAEFLHR